MGRAHVARRGCNSRRLTPGLRRPAGLASFLSRFRRLRFPRPAAAACLLALAVLLGAGAAEAQTEVELVSNMDQADGTTGGFDNDHAQWFTTGSHALGYKLKSVELEMQTASGTTPTFSVSIWSETTAGFPDAKVGDLTRQGSLSATFGTVEFTHADGIDLDPGTSYFVVIDVTASPNANTKARLTASEDEDPNPSAGWTIGNGRMFRNATDGTTNFSIDTGSSLKLAIHGHKKAQLAPPLTPAGSLVSNIGRTADGEATLSNDLAQQFETGSHAAGYQVSEVAIRMRKQGSQPTPTFRVTIRPDAGGEPGTQTSQLTLQGSLSSTFDDVRFKAFRPDGISLEPDTKYWVMIDVTGGANGNTRVQRTSDKGQTAGSTGWEIANSRLHRVATATAWDSTFANVLQIDVRGTEKIAGPALSSAAVTDKKLTLTFAAALDQSSVPLAEQFTVKVGGTGRAVTGVAMGGAAGNFRTVVLTLASAVGGHPSDPAQRQSVTVSYERPPAQGDPLRNLAFQNVPDFTDRTVTNNTTNRAPVFNGTISENRLNPRDAPVSTLLSTGVNESDFSDPDGNPLTFSLSADRDGVYSLLSYSGNRLWINTVSGCVLENLDPPPPKPFTTIVTLTATDPSGATAHADWVLLTGYGTAEGGVACPTLTSAAVTDKTLTLTYHVAPRASWAPSEADFEVKVDGDVVALADADPVSVSGSTVTLTLAAPVGAGQEVTVSHAVGDDPSTVGFTDESVTNSSTNNAPTATVDDPNELTKNAPPGTSVNVGITFADADNETLTFAWEAARKDVFDADNTGHVAAVNTFFLRILPVCALRALDPPPPPSPFETTVTVTASDPTGAQASVEIVATTTWDEADCPELLGAIVNGATVTLVYDQALDEDEVPGKDRFAVEVDGTAADLAASNAVEVDGKRVVLTLAEAVIAGARVRVSYTLPRFGGTQSAEGHDAAGFEDVEATNVAGDTRPPVLRGLYLEGSTLTVVYDELLDPASVPLPAQYVLLGAGGPNVTDVTVTGSWVVLTLASAVAADLNVLVTYDCCVATSAVPVRDYADNRAADFTQEEVTHGPPPEPQAPSGGGAPSPGGGGGLDLHLHGP